jgi:hypothetical protein
MRTTVAPGRWHLEGRTGSWRVSVEGEAAPREAHVLPVPLPELGQSVPTAHEHLAGRLAVTVRRRGQVVFADESRIAGPEQGSAPLGPSGAGAYPWL